MRTTIFLATLATIGVVSAIPESKSLIEADADNLGCYI